MARTGAPDAPESTCPFETDNLLGPHSSAKVAHTIASKNTPHCAYTREQWLDLLPTTGGLTRLPADKVAEVLAEVAAAIDAMGGGFTMPFTTLATAATRTGAAL
ncbi:MAG: hypothetical protein ACRDVE_07220 [Actinocrinis sp.]